METFQLITLIYFFTFILGNFLEKFRIPWIFSSLLLGFIFSFFSFPISQTFIFLATLGMYFLLFMIGFEIDLHEMRKESKFIAFSTASIILFESIFGMLLVTLIFNLSPYLAFLISLSFATVGEAILLPILDEFKMINTKLGRAIIGIGVLDDIFEVFVIVIITSFIGLTYSTLSKISVTLLSLTLLFFSAFLLTKMRKEGKKFKNYSIETLFLFVMFIFFLFLSIGYENDLTALASLLAGIALKNFIPKERLKLIENEIRSICYGLFAPLFFFWVGKTVNLNYIFQNPFVLLLFFIIPAFSKIFPSYLIGRKYLGSKKSLILGIGLCTRFSTSIIIIKYLFERNFIPIGLYTVLISSTALFTIIIPLLFSFLLNKCN